MSASLVVADTTGMSNKAAERHIAYVKKYESKKELLKESADRLASSVLAFATGLGVGYIEGRYPDKAEVVGIPLPLVIAAGGFVASIALPDQYAGYAVDIGNAGSAIYGRDVAYDLGTKKREKAAGVTAPAPAVKQSGFAPYPKAA